MITTKLLWKPILHRQTTGRWKPFHILSLEPLFPEGLRQAGLFFFLLLIIVAAPARTEEEITNYFSDTYQEARTKFLNAAKLSGGNIAHYRNPNLGAENEELYTDVVTFNLPGASTILVLGSGTHGVEGFAGSGIQVGLLREGIHKSLPKGVGLLFYHALNPYGFSHLRRFNEDNVDLNRNFVDHSKCYPENEGYDELAWLIEPTSLSTWQDIKAKLSIAWYRVTKGKLWLQTAISQGQYNHPEGLFYGGNTETWSNRVLRQITEKQLSSASRLVLIDFHTGLGKYGAAEIIAGVNPGTPAYEQMLQWWGDRLKTPCGGDSVSPPVYGSLKQGFSIMLPDIEVTAVSLEFGTYPVSEVFWALRAENHVHHHGGWGHPDLHKTKNELKRVFYPDMSDWKQAVWLQGKEVVQQALVNLQ